MCDPKEFEKYPGKNPETAESYNQVPQEFDSLQDMPERRWDQFGTSLNDEAHNNPASGEQKQDQNEYDEGLTYASALINYGLDAVAREIGVEPTVQGIKSFDASSSENPIRDLFDHLGIDSQKEFEDVRDESEATKKNREQLRKEYNMPKTEKRTREGAVKAIADMKELIIEVEGADPRYNELREKASAAGKGYFEYAVQNYGMRGLTELFSTLAAQKEKEPKQESEAKLEERIDTENAPQPDKNDAEKETNESEQEPLEDQEEKEDIENGIEHPFIKDKVENDATAKVEGALHQVVPESEQEEKAAPSAGSEKEKDPSYRSGQEKQVI